MIRLAQSVLAVAVVLAVMPLRAQTADQVAPDELEDIGDPGETEPKPDEAGEAPVEEETTAASDPTSSASEPKDEPTPATAETASQAPHEHASKGERDQPAAEPAESGAKDDDPSSSEPGVHQAEGEKKETKSEEAATATSTPARDDAVGDVPPVVQAQLHVLSIIEGRLSVGDELNASQLQELRRLSSEGAHPRVRALATAILPWLGPVVLNPITSATGDADAMVRAQAMHSLVALVRAMNDGQRTATYALAENALQDPSHEVACGAARLMVSLDAQTAAETLEALAERADDVRFGCYRQYAGFPMRDVMVPAPTLPDPVRADNDEGADALAADDQMSLMDGLGRGILITTFAGAGVVAGGLLNGTFSPPRDTLTYTRRTTTQTREEPNVLLGATGALVGGAALGAAAFGLQYGLGWADFAPATTVLGMTVAGAASGYGLGLALNLPEPWQGLSMIGGTLGGLAVSAPFVWVLKPTEKDLTLMASAAGAMTLSGAMLTFVVIPEGFPVLFDRVRRADFGTGMGLMAGGIGAVGALMASPLLELSHGRMLAASGAGLLAGATGLAAGYLIPVGFDALGLPITRSRIASGLGLVFGWAAASAAFVLLPDSWARIFERVRSNKATSAVAVEDGRLKIGTPMVWTRDVSSLKERRVAIGLDLLSGDF